MQQHTFIALLSLLLAVTACDDGGGGNTTLLIDDATISDGARDDDASETDATVDADAEVIDSDAEVIDSDAEVIDSDAEVIDSDAEVIDPDAEVIDPDAEVIEPDAEIIEPDAEVIDPDMGIPVPRCGALDAVVGEFEADGPDRWVANGFPTAASDIQGSCGAPGPQLVLRFQAPRAGHFQFLTHSPRGFVDAVKYARTTCDRPEDEIACASVSDDVVTYGTRPLELSLEAGEVVFVFVDTESPVTLNAPLNVTAHRIDLNAERRPSIQAVRAVDRGVSLAFEVTGEDLQADVTTYRVVLFNGETPIVVPPFEPQIYTTFGKRSFTEVVITPTLPGATHARVWLRDLEGNQSDPFDVQLEAEVRIPEGQACVRRGLVRCIVGAACTGLEGRCRTPQAPTTLAEASGRRAQISRAGFIQAGVVLTVAGRDPSLTPHNIQLDWQDAQGTTLAQGLRPIDPPPSQADFTVTALASMPQGATQVAIRALSRFAEPSEPLVLQVADFEALAEVAPGQPCDIAHLENGCSDGLTCVRGALGAPICAETAPELTAVHATFSAGVVGLSVNGTDPGNDVVLVVTEFLDAQGDVAAALRGAEFSELVQGDGAFAGQAVIDRVPPEATSVRVSIMDAAQAQAPIVEVDLSAPQLAVDANCVPQNPHEGCAPGLMCLDPEAVGIGICVPSTAPEIQIVEGYVSNGSAFSVDLLGEDQQSDVTQFTLRFLGANGVALPGFETPVSFEPDQLVIEQESFGAHFAGELDVQGAATVEVVAFDSAGHESAVASAPLAAPQALELESGCDAVDARGACPPAAECRVDPEAFLPFCQPKIGCHEQFAFDLTAAMALQFSQTFGTTFSGGGMETVAPGDCGQPAATAHIYEFTPQVTETYRFETNLRGDAGADTVLWLRSACGDQGEQLACNDDVVPGELRSMVEIDLEAGQRVFIFVAPYVNSPTDSYDLVVSVPYFGQ